MHRVVLAGFVSALLAVSAGATVKTALVEYKQGDQVLEGFLAWDDAVAGLRPGVLVVHEWKGLGAYARSRAEQLAQLGYVAFAADIYGKGIRPTTNDEAAKEAGKYYADRALLRARVNAGLEQLRKSAHVDTSRLAAIGYCFGGSTVLELARSGAAVRGIVSFHGGLMSPTPEDARNIKARVLACHGGADPYVGPEEVAGFQREMTDAGVDWQLNVYGGAVHSFTNPEAGDDPVRGAAYNANADHRSWEAMKQFFAEIFK